MAEFSDPHRAFIAKQFLFFVAAARLPGCIQTWAAR